MRTPRFGFPKSREKQSTKNITVVFPSSRARAAFPAHSFFHTTTVCRVCHQRMNNDEKIFNFDRRTGFDPADVFETKFYLFSFNISGGSEPGIRTGLSLRELRHERGKNAGCSAAPLPSRQSTPRRRRTGRLAVASSQNTALTCIARPLAERRRSIPLRPPATWRPVTSSRREMRTWTRSRFPGRCPARTLPRARAAPR